MKENKFEQKLNTSLSKSLPDDFDQKFWSRFDKEARKNKSTVSLFQFATSIAIMLTVFLSYEYLDKQKAPAGELIASIELLEHYDDISIMAELRLSDDDLLMLLEEKS